jgi:hypothetical protein
MITPATKPCRSPNTRGWRLCFLGLWLHADYPVLRFSSLFMARLGGRASPGMTSRQAYQVWGRRAPAAGAARRRRCHVLAQATGVDVSASERGGEPGRQVGAPDTEPGPCGSGRAVEDELVRKVSFAGGIASQSRIGRACRALYLAPRVYPNVKAYAWAPGWRNVISSVRARTVSCWRMSW